MRHHSERLPLPCSHRGEHSFHAFIGDPASAFTCNKAFCADPRVSFGLTPYFAFGACSFFFFWHTHRTELHHLLSDSTDCKTTCDIVIFSHAASGTLQYLVLYTCFLPRSRSLLVFLTLLTLCRQELTKSTKLGTGSFAQGRSAPKTLGSSRMPAHPGSKSCPSTSEALKGLRRVELRCGRLLAST